MSVEKVAKVIRAQGRQGDILLQPVGEREAELIRESVGKNRVRLDAKAVVGLGETTGHRHEVLDAWVVVDSGFDEGDLELFQVGTESMPVWVVADEDTTIAHLDADNKETGEHAPIPVPAGVYRVIRQEEVDPFTSRGRMVID